MKKIGILTFHWAFNYGAVLQCYALFSYIKSLGYNVEIIDYRPQWAYSCRHPKFPKGIGQLVKTIDYYAKKRIFRAFVSKHLKISSFAANQANAFSDFSIVIVGSDQVFNPDIIAPKGILDKMYLLDIPLFDTTKKISYAASFGNSTLDAQYIPQYEKALGQFKKVSVREKSGLAILESLNISERHCVTDPTFLIESYSGLNLPKISKEKYVLTFFFQSSNLTHSASMYVSNYFEDLKIKNISSLYKKLRYDRKSVSNLTPSEWIACIRDARFVITDSFHCVVFSIIMHTPFIAIALDAWGNDWSERIRFLLSELDLSERLLKSDDISKIKQIIETPINWENIDSKVNLFRESSQDFLIEALRDG